MNQIYVTRYVTCGDSGANLFFSDHRSFFRNCQQVASLARPEAIKMLSEVRRRADGQARSGTSQLDAQLVTQVVFA